MNTVVGSTKVQHVVTSYGVGLSAHIDQDPALFTLTYIPVN
jgi:hypothetical protein